MRSCKRAGVDASRVSVRSQLSQIRSQLSRILVISSVRVISDLWSELQRLHLCRLSLFVAAAMRACRRSHVISCLCFFPKSVTNLYTSFKAQWANTSS